MTEKDEYCPKMYGNTYIQHQGGMIGQWGGNEDGEPPIEFFDKDAEKTICDKWSDTDAEIYIIS